MIMLLIKSKIALHVRVNQFDLGGMNLRVYTFQNEAIVKTKKNGH